MHSENVDQGQAPEKTFHIIVNGRPRAVTDRRLSYAEVVHLAYPDCPADPNVIFTVSYANPHGRDGTLADGQEVPVRDGMSFCVGKTGRS